MSGDVQPRKRKDKKKKKDDLGVEEPRGTAAVFGEGDVFMHSQHDHGTGGHWCAKIIFFSLLAILIGLIGLIILENRGLTELEANSVESRYSGVLEGWLEDAPEDDHHDEHTLELNHPDEEEDAHSDEHDNEDEHDDGGIDDDHDEGDDEEHDKIDDDDHDEIDDDEDQDQDDSDERDNADDDDLSEENDGDHEDEQQDDNISHEEDLEDTDDVDEPEGRYKRYIAEAVDEDDEDQSDENSDELQHIGDNESEEADEQNQIDDDEVDVDQSAEQEDNNEQEKYVEEDEDHEEEEEVDNEIEIERIEREASEEEPISTELPALPEEDDEDDNSQELSNEIEPTEVEGDGVAAEDVDDDEEYLEDDTDEPPIERITAPAGKPFVEVEEEEVSSEQPPDTLDEEEQYEKEQEKLRREREKTSHMWLKLTVGGALLVATHAVVRRAAGPRDAPEREERSVREETPIIDRRMTLIPEEPPKPVAPKTSPHESYRPTIKEEVVQRVPLISQSAPQQEKEVEDEEEQEEDEDIETVNAPEETEDKELYSDEEVEEEEVVAEKTNPKAVVEKLEEKIVTKPEPHPEDDDPDDVEIIDDEQLEEEMEDEEDEEDISDVDDAELLTRLEAKYGRLPEPERPASKHKDGGNSIEDEWPGEPSDAYWRQQLDSAEREIQQGEWAAAVHRAAQPQLRDSGRARWLVARGTDLEAEARRDNRLLTRAITAYLDLLKMNERLSDNKLLEITDRTLDRIKFRGNYLNAEPVYRLLIRRFPEELSYRNNLTVSFLMANRADLAEDVLKETLERWPNDRVALAHYGFVLKTQHNRLEEAVEAFQKALEGDAGPANEPRFYYHLGDALLLLGRPAEAHEVHKRGAALKHFLSPSQRSLYNVPRLKSRPWWNVEETPYQKLARALEKSWKDILKEGEAAKALYEKEKEGLKERGEWSQLDLFVRGQEIPNRCKRAPVTCAIVKSEAAAAGCRRGQIKFSAMQPGTHVRAHVGPTNCRIRMHLALSNTKDTFIRVDQTTRQWEVGKVLMFDDSFEHEVWHNGTGTRLVLIVDVWHPDLTPAERRTLPAI